MAIKSQNALFSVSTAEAAADNITAITAANPPVVTCGTHGITNGKLIRITGVVGMTQVNDRAFIAANVAATTLELKGVDGTGYTAWASGGQVFETTTLTAVGEVTGVSGFDGVSDEIDTTHLRSTAKEFLVGLQDFGNLGLELNLANSDTGQTKLRTLKASSAIGTFSFQLSDGTVAAFRALVRSFTVQNPTNEAARSSAQLRITGEPAWFA
jgi:hypothetical protein